MDVEKMPITEQDEDDQQQHKQDSSCIQPPLQYPWLLIPRNGTDEGYICCTSPLYRGFSTKFFPNLRIDRVFNCCYGWLICSNYHDSLFLWNPVKTKLIQLPQLKLKGKQLIQDAVLSSPPDDLEFPNCMVMLFLLDNVDNGEFCIRYCLLEKLLGRDEFNDNWESVCYDDGGTDFIQRPTIFNDAVYALRGVSELVCIDRVDQTGLIATSYVRLPEFSSSLIPIQHLVESCGELFYVVIYSADFSEEHYETIEAFKLDQVNKTWNKVREIADRVFFFNTSYCISSATTTKGGYMCFVSQHSCSLYSYSYGDNTVSSSYLPTFFNLPSPSRLLGRYSSIPYLPHRLKDGSFVEMNLVKSGVYKAAKRKIRNEPEELKVYEPINGAGECRLYRFLKKLITFIATRTINSPLRPQALSPWLMVTTVNGYRFVDSELGGLYSKTIPQSLVGTRIICSSNGWLLLSSKSFEEFCLYNPFTTRIVELPKPPLQFDESWNIGFSSPPASLKCVVVSMYNAKIYFLVVGSEKWQTYLVVDDDDFFRDSCHSPVFHDGSFWILGNQGLTLGAFSVEDDGQASWKVVALAEDPYSLWFDKKLLVSCEENLLLVATGEVGEVVKVFVLNRTTMCWVLITDLGNHALYLCRSSSFSTPARAKWMNNAIFLPRVLNEDKDRIVYYSMDTGKYHSLVDKDNAVKFHDTAELLLSNWIQPSWS